ncbi:hypothetical protein ACFXK0_23035 [Nocardia sp. NPDC059177]|uniref:hypothetical protein n=1 Tax=Nocardia sp. NPDC059177 TaxID=3346759 RepID=UPI0036B8965A
MASLLLEDLPQAVTALFARRARHAGSTITEQVRAELIRIAERPVAIDAVVRFVEQHRAPAPVIDAHATALTTVYSLPANTWQVLCRRAAASAQPVSDYVRHELVVAARNPTLDDVRAEFLDLQNANPDLPIDIDAVLASARYARAMS